ncbi:hypothetical protein ES703_105450 [subsurface metagenome]
MRLKLIPKITELNSIIPKKPYLTPSGGTDPPIIGDWATRNVMVTITGMTSWVKVSRRRIRDLKSFLINADSNTENPSLPRNPLLEDLNSTGFSL